MALRNIEIKGEKWRWQAALKSGCVMVRTPENKSHKVMLADLIPGYVYDPNEVIVTPITPGMVSNYVTNNLALFAR